MGYSEGLPALGQAGLPSALGTPGGSRGAADVGSTSPPLPPQLEGEPKLHTGCPRHAVTTCTAAPRDAWWDVWQ